MTVIPTLQLSSSHWCFFHLDDVKQADGRDLLWLVEFFWSVLVSSGWVLSKTPAMSLQWKGHIYRAGVADLYLLSIWTNKGKVAASR